MKRSTQIILIVVSGVFLSLAVLAVAFSALISNKASALSNEILIFPDPDTTRSAQWFYNRQQTAYTGQTRLKPLILVLNYPFGYVIPRGDRKAAVYQHPELRVTMQVPYSWNTGADGTNTFFARKTRRSEAEMVKMFYGCSQETNIDAFARLFNDTLTYRQTSTKPGFLDSGEGIDPLGRAYSLYRYERNGRIFADYIYRKNETENIVVTHEYQQDEPYSDEAIKLALGTLKFDDWACKEIDSYWPGFNLLPGTRPSDPWQRVPALSAEHVNIAKEFFFKGNQPE